MFQRKPVWKDKNIKKAKRYVEKITDSPQLMEIALSDVDRQVGEAAIQKITDQAALIEISISSRNIYNRLAALKKINSDKELADIAIRNDGNIVSEAAIERLTDSKLLAGIAQSVRNETSAKKALLRIQLKEYVLPFMDDPRVALSITARHKIKEFEKEEARKIESGWLTKAAQMTSELELAQFAYSAYENGQHAVCKAVVERMADKTAIAGLAMKIADYTRRTCAGNVESLVAMLKKIDDEKVLAEIAKIAYFKDIMYYTLGRITDNALIADIAENGLFRDIQTSAIDKLDHYAELSDAALKRIIKNHWDAYVRCHAVRFMNDTYFIREILDTEKDSDVKRKAKDRLDFLSGEGNVCW